MSLAAGSSVRIEVLGEFRLLVDGVEVVVSRPQVRLVLARLAIAPGTVSVLDLIDLLWPGKLPNDPSAALRTILSRARSVLGSHEALIDGDGRRYQMDADCDVSEFEALVATTSSDGASRLSILERALGLWRGDAFVDLGDGPVFDEYEVHLANRRLAARRELAEKYESAGYFEKAVRTAEVVLGCTPDDENTALVVARSLARLGRKSEAIHALDQLRGSLRQRGLEVSRALVAAESVILRGSFDLFETDPGGHSECLIGKTLVGRESELLALRESEALSTTLIEGTGGMGKSAILDEYAAALARSGQLCLSVAASANPKRPLEVFGDIVEGLLELGLQPRPEHQGAIRVVSRGLFETSERPPGREVLMAALVDLVASSCEDLGLTIVVDDVHWLDMASVLALNQLAASNRCRLVLATRPGLREQLGWLGDESAIGLIKLAPLSARACDVLVKNEISCLADAQSGLLYKRSGGNPLFLKILLDLAGDDMDTNGPLPPVVLLAVQKRLASLGGGARRVLQTASVFGKDFTPDALSRLVHGVKSGLEEAVASGIVCEGSSPGSFTFSHALVADAIYQMLSEGERVALHDHAGRILEGMGEEPMAIWPHCREAVELDGARAVHFATLSAGQHLDAYDWYGALEVIDWAFELLSNFEPGSLGPTHNLIIGQAKAQLALGVRDSHHRLIEGTQQARAAGDEAAMVTATIELCNSGAIALTGIEMAPVVELVEASLKADITHERRVELWAASARAFVYSSRGDYGRDLYAKAFAEFDNCSVPVQDLILRNSEAGLCDPDDLELAKRATLLMEAASDHKPELRWLVRWFQFRDALIRGDGERLARAMSDLRSPIKPEERRHAFVVLGQTSDMEMQRSWAESTFSMIHGDLDLAELQANEALGAGLKQLEIRGDGFGSGWVMNAYGLLLLAIRHRQGRLGELVDLVEAESPPIPAWSVAIVVSNYAAGRLDRVRDLLPKLCANGFAALVRDPTWTAAMWLLAEPVAEMMDRSESEALYRQLEPYSGRMSYSGLCTFGPIDGALSILAQSLGWEERAIDHSERSKVTSDRLIRDSSWAVATALK